MGKRARKIMSRAFGFLVAAVLIVLVVMAVSYKQEVRDFLSAQGFDPSPRATEVLTELQLTPRGERVFLASRPTVDGSQHFNKQCAGVNHSEGGHVLGCYSQDRIRLFDVTDERIADIVEVTGAHELLHAAYARIGEADRKVLAHELQATFDELSAQDPALAERMSVYDHLSPDAYINELHSVLGSEVRSLPDTLEQHYATYFEDRGSVIDRFDQFHAVFAGIQEQSEAIDAEMTALKESIELRSVEYDHLVNSFNADAAEFKARNDRFEFSKKADEFESIRASLAQRRDALDASLAGIQADIDHYNQLRSQLQELGQVSSELDEYLNSSLAPATDTPE